MICRNHVDVAAGVRRCARCGSPFCSDCLVDIAERPYCAACKTEQLLDVRSGVDNVTMDFASVGRRFVGVFIDGIILRLVGTLMGFGLGVTMAASGQQSLFYAGIILGVIINISYDAVLVAVRGQTVGKMAMKVRVVNANGGELTQGQAWGRALVKAFLPLITFIPAFFTPDKRTLHDMAAGTRVVNWV